MALGRWKISVVMVLLVGRLAFGKDDSTEWRAYLAPALGSYSVLVPNDLSESSFGVAGTMTLGSRSEAAGGGVFAKAGAGFAEVGGGLQVVPLFGLGLEFWPTRDLGVGVSGPVLPEVTFTFPPGHQVSLGLFPAFLAGGGSAVATITYGYRFGL